LCVSVGIIKECFNTVDARCKHEDNFQIIVKQNSRWVTYGVLYIGNNNRWPTTFHTRKKSYSTSSCSITPCHNIFINVRSRDIPSSYDIEQSTKEAR